MSAERGRGPGARAGHGLPRADRILTRRDFLRVQREGRRVHTPHFIVMVLAGARQRLGITVTRRTSGAVGRNRVKRLVREVFRRRRELFPADCDFVLVARAGSQALDYGALERELAEASPALLRAARPNPTSHRTQK